MGYQPKWKFSLTGKRKASNRNTRLKQGHAITCEIRRQSAPTQTHMRWRFKLRMSILPSGPVDLSSSGIMQKHGAPDEYDWRLWPPFNARQKLKVASRPTQQLMN